jgi:hypothetical protein
MSAAEELRRPRFELEAILYGALTPTSHDHDVIAVALNERYSELGANHPLPYTRDDEPDEDQPQPKR